MKNLIRGDVYCGSNDPRDYFTNEISHVYNFIQTLQERYVAGLTVEECLKSLHSRVRIVASEFSYEMYLKLFKPCCNRYGFVDHYFYHMQGDCGRANVFIPIWLFTVKGGPFYECLDRMDRTINRSTDMLLFFLEDHTRTLDHKFQYKFSSIQFLVRTGQIRVKGPKGAKERSTENIFRAMMTREAFPAIEKDEYLPGPYPDVLARLHAHYHSGCSDAP